MKITVDHRRRRQLPEGGPWLLWRRVPKTRGGGREGLVLDLNACDNRECSCREVKLHGVRVQDDLIDVELKPGGGLSLSYPSTETPRPPSTGGMDLNAWIEFESGEVGFTNPKDRIGAAAELLAWLRSEVDGDLLDRLYEEWLRAKAWKRREEPDWEALGSVESGEMAYWQEVFPDERPDVFLLRDGAFRVWDAHCIRPQCVCTESRLMVLEEAGRKSREVGSVVVDFNRGAAKDFDAVTVSKSTLRRVWRAYSSRHRVSERLSARKRRLVELSEQVDRPSLPAPPPQPRAAVKIGRNQPCPCGSGKKYKRCCGRPKGAQ